MLPTPIQVSVLLPLAHSSHYHKAIVSLWLTVSFHLRLLLSGGTAQELQSLELEYLLLLTPPTINYSIYGSCFWSSTGNNSFSSEQNCINTKKPEKTRAWSLDSKGRLCFWQNVEP